MKTFLRYLNSLYTFSDTLETSMRCETRLQSMRSCGSLRSRAKEIARERGKRGREREREREREGMQRHRGLSRGGVIYGSRVGRMGSGYTGYV